jgi:L-threonylcarbamoyladenylate synthase
LILCEDWLEREELRDRGDSTRSGLLTLRPPRTEGPFEAVEVLSASGDLPEAAANLFAALYRLDALGLDRIVAVKVPDVGLGLAINDRLRRAAHKPLDAVREGAT